MLATFPSPNFLKRAAEMRANGNSWELVARRFDTDADTARDWAETDLVAWKRAFRLARMEIVEDGIAEATVALRKQLRSEDDRTVREAAGWLYRLSMTKIRHRRKKAPKPKEPEKPKGKTLDECFAVARFGWQRQQSEPDRPRGC